MEDNYLIGSWLKDGDDCCYEIEVLSVTSNLVAFRYIWHSLQSYSNSIEWLPKEEFIPLIKDFEKNGGKNG